MTKYKLSVVRKDNDSETDPNFIIKEEGLCPYTTENKEEIVKAGLRSLRKFGELEMELKSEWKVDKLTHDNN